MDTNISPPFMVERFKRTRRGIRGDFDLMQSFFLSKIWCSLDFTLLYHWIFFVWNRE